MRSALSLRRTARLATTTTATTTTPLNPSSPPQRFKKKKALYAVDPDLRAHRDHLDYRWRRYVEARDEIVRAEGSLEAFAGAHLGRLGVSRDAARGETVYREWAPGAQAAALIGDFSGWEPRWMTKDEFGVWEVRLPDGPGGEPAIPHASRYKVRLQSVHGWWADRVPAMARYAAAPPGEMGARFDAVHWDPPESERHAFAHPRPPPPRSLRIYEAHVGMSSEEEKVGLFERGEWTRGCGVCEGGAGGVREVGGGGASDRRGETTTRREKKPPNTQRHDPLPSKQSHTSHHHHQSKNPHTTRTTQHTQKQQQ